VLDHLTLRSGGRSPPLPRTTTGYHLSTLPGWATSCALLVSQPKGLLARRYRRGREGLTTGPSHTAGKRSSALGRWVAWRPNPSLGPRWPLLSRYGDQKGRSAVLVAHKVNAPDLILRGWIVPGGFEQSDAVASAIGATPRHHERRAFRRFIPPV